MSLVVSTHCYTNTMPNLVIPVGIPGSGKSTWGTTLLGEGKYSVVCSDNIRRRIWGSLIEAHNCGPEVKQERTERVWKEFYADVEEKLKHNIDVYADGTNLRDFAREKLRDIAVRTGARTHLILFDNVVQALERNVSREEDKVVPDEVQLAFINQFALVLEDLKLGEEQRYDSVTRIENLGPNA